MSLAFFTLSLMFTYVTTFYCVGGFTIFRFDGLTGGTDRNLDLDSDHGRFL